MNYTDALQLAKLISTATTSWTAQPIRPNPEAEDWGVGATRQRSDGEIAMIIVNDQVFAGYLLLDAIDARERLSLPAKEPTGAEAGTQVHGAPTPTRRKLGDKPDNSALLGPSPVSKG